MNKLALESGYYILCFYNKENDILIITVGSGFSMKKGITKYIIKYHDEFCSLYEVINNEEKLLVKKDLSEKIRRYNLDTKAFMQTMAETLVKTVVEIHGADESFINYEEA